MQKVMRFPKPSELPKPSIDMFKVNSRLQSVADAVIKANVSGAKMVVVELRKNLNELEMALVYETIEKQGYRIEYHGGYHGIYWG